VLLLLLCLVFQGTGSNGSIDPLFDRLLLLVDTFLIVMDVANFTVLVDRIVVAEAILGLYLWQFDNSKTLPYRLRL